MNEYLSGLLQSGAKSAGDNLVGTAITALTGGFKGRPQWRDLEFMDDVATRLTPNEANRYNTYQSMTFGEDTKRQMERMDALFPGTSPWERLGAGAATPLPAQPMQDSSAHKSAAYLGPMQTAKLQASTQLQMAQIAAQAQRDVANIQTGGGELPKANIEQVRAQTGLTLGQTELTAAQQILTAAQTDTTKAQEHLAFTQAGVLENRALLDSIETLLNAMPKTTVDLGVLKSEHREGWRDVVGLMEQIDRLPHKGEIRDVLAQLPEQQFNDMMESVIAVAGLITAAAKGAAGAVHTGTQAIHGARRFLRGLAP